MSHTYQLLCRECLRYLDLGKIVNSDAGTPIPWAFGGWRDLDSGDRIEGCDLWRLVERFLIVHRNHPLQVVSDAYRAKADPDYEWQSYDSAAEVLATEPVPEPDDYEDADELVRRDRAKGGDPT